MQAYTALIESVKSVQRTSVEAREHWHSLCDTHRSGMRDPTQLDPAFLNFYLKVAQDRSKEAELPVPHAPSPMQLQEQVQKTSLVFKVERLFGLKKIKKAWDRACDRDCAGERDPQKLDIAFIQRFLIKHDDGSVPSAPVVAASASLVAEVPFNGTGGWGLARQRDGLATVEQVEGVKSAQRISQYWRDVWQKRCDEGSHGMRDPSQLSGDFIQGFLDQVEAEEIASGAKGYAKGAGSKGAWPDGCAAWGEHCAKGAVDGVSWGKGASDGGGWGKGAGDSGGWGKGASDDVGWGKGVGNGGGWAKGFGDSSWGKGAGNGVGWVKGAGDGGWGKGANDGVGWGKGAIDGGSWGKGASDGGWPAWSGVGGGMTWDADGAGGASWTWDGGGCGGWLGCRGPSEWLPAWSAAKGGAAWPCESLGASVNGAAAWPGTGGGGGLAWLGGGDTSEEPSVKRQRTDMEGAPAVTPW